MNNNHTLTIIASILCFSNMTLSNVSFVDTLYENKDQVHIHLLQNSPLFDYQIGNSQDSLKILFSLAKYDEYISAYDAKYTSLSESENEERYLYLLSKYNLKKYKSLHDILISIKYENLSPRQRNNVTLLNAVDLFIDKKYKELETLYIKISESDSLPVDVLASIEKMRDILYIQEYKPSKFIQKDEDYSMTQAWNSVLTGDYEMALSYYKQAKLTSTNPMVLYTQGMSSLALGKFDAARDYFINILDPQLEKEKNYRIIETYYYDTNVFETLNQIKQFKQTYPKDSNYRDSLNYIEAMTNVVSKNYEIAKKQLRLLKTNNSAQYYLAELLHQDNKFSEAIPIYQDILSKSDANTVFYYKSLYGLAWSQFKLGQYVSAKVNFAEIATIKNKDIDSTLHAYVKIADASYNLHKYKDSLKEYHQAVNNLVPYKSTYPKLYKHSIFNVARIYSKLRKYKQSNEYLSQYLKGTDKIADVITAKMLQAGNYTKLKQNNNAAEILQELILTYQPKNEDIYILLADSYFNMKSYQKAIDAYQDYLNVFPVGNRVLDAKYGTVHSLFYLKDYEEALKLAKETDEMFQSQLHEELEEKIKFNKEQEND